MSPALEWLPRMFHRLWPALLATAIVACGCTTVPTKEFSTYQDTFAEARAAGQEVLLDYGASAKQLDERIAKRAAANPKPKERGQPFDPQAIAQKAAGVDHIAVRMKAWDVVARYNDLLSALAEGRSADELAAAADGLSTSLGSFPVAAISTSWAEIGGYLAPLKPLALEAVREKSRRDFIAAVGKGGPLITDKLIQLLRDDAKNFYQVKFGLNELEYQPAVDAVSEARNHFAMLANQFQAAPEIYVELSGLNAAIARLPVQRVGTSTVKALDGLTLKPVAGAAQISPEGLAQLRSLRADASALVDRASASDAELDAYQEVLTTYVGLLNQLEQSMRALEAAALQAQPGIPQAADLQRTVILLREAYITYKDMGKE